MNEHIKNIYSEGELSEEATIRKNRIVQNEGSREIEREVTFCNLERPNVPVISTSTYSYIFEMTIFNA